MRPHFLLAFGTTLGRTRTLRINNPLTSANDSTVRNAMNSMINSQTIVGASGSINSPRRASLVETHITSLDLNL